jgi:hypothetical protein
LGNTFTSQVPNQIGGLFSLTSVLQDRQNLRIVDAKQMAASQDIEDVRPSESQTSHGGTLGVVGSVADCYVGR